MIADDRKDDERDQHRRGEEVLDEGQPVALADQGDVKTTLEESAVRLDDREEQDGEAPHREEVRQPRHGPLEQLSLTGHLHDLGVGDLGEAVPATRRWLAGPNQPREPVEALPGDGVADHRDRQPDDDPR